MTDPQTFNQGKPKSPCFLETECHIGIPKVLLKNPTCNNFKESSSEKISEELEEILYKQSGMCLYFS